MSQWWVDASGGEIPPNAVPICTTQDGETLYVGRQELNGDLVPGKISPQQSVLYYGQNMTEFCCRDYQALVCDNPDSLVWREAYDGGIPEGAIEAGLVGSTGEVLYVARGCPAPDDPSLVHGGKLHSSHGCAYIIWAGKEYMCKNYEVLCAV